MVRRGRGGEVLILSSLGVREMEHRRANGEVEVVWDSGLVLHLGITEEGLLFVLEGGSL